MDILWAGFVGGSLGSLFAVVYHLARRVRELKEGLAFEVCRLSVVAARYDSLRKTVSKLDDAWAETPVDDDTEGHPF